MNWWNILKNAKISGKAKGEGVGTSFDASKIKINIDKDDCKKELKQILSNALNYADPSEVQEEFIVNELPEEVACKFIKALKYKLPPNYSSNNKIFYGNCRIVVQEQKIGSYDDNYTIVIFNEKYRSMYVALRAPSGVQFARFVFTAKDYARWVKSI